MDRGAYPSTLNSGHKPAECVAICDSWHLDQGSMGEGALEVNFDGTQNTMVSLCTRQPHSICGEILHQPLQLFRWFNADHNLRTGQLKRGHQRTEKACERAWLDALHTNSNMRPGVCNA